MFMVICNKNAGLFVSVLQSEGEDGVCKSRRISLAVKLTLASAQTPVLTVFCVHVQLFVFFFLKL